MTDVSEVHTILISPVYLRQFNIYIYDDVESDWFTRELWNIHLIPSNRKGQNICSELLYTSTIGFFKKNVSNVNRTQLITLRTSLFLGALPDPERASAYGCNTITITQMELSP